MPVISEAGGQIDLWRAAWSLEGIPEQPGYMTLFQKDGCVCVCVQHIVSYWCSCLAFVLKNSLFIVRVAFSGTSLGLSVLFWDPRLLQRFCSLS